MTEPGPATGRDDGHTAELRLAELLAALSLVTDLGMGEPPESAMRACLRATALARRRGMPEADVAHVYYTTLLRYLGCTAFAHEEASAFGGDDLALRSRGALVDDANLFEMLPFLLLQPGRGRPLPRRVMVVARGLTLGAGFGAQLAAAHCEVASHLAGRLGLPAEVQRGLYQLMERWDGKGGPQGLRGEQICTPARYALIATRVVLFENVLGPASAFGLVRKWSGTVFDPELAQDLLEHQGQSSPDVEAGDVLQAVVEAEPEPRIIVPEERLHDVATALGDLVDLKVPFLRGHSRGVARLAGEAARALGLDAPQARDVARAAHLHDIGRVAVANGVWEKPGRPSTGEWEQIRLHPYHGERILSRIPSLRRLAPLAAAHHERLDGSGYHRGSHAADLPLPARVLAAADAYQAMTQARPYRRALAAEQAADEIRAEVGAGRLDGEAVAAVLGAAGQGDATVARAWPSGLSDREVEVLRLLARGAPNKRVARELGISPKTVGHHVQNIYEKIGVSTRAAAAVFAMERGLLH